MKYDLPETIIKATCGISVAIATIWLGYSLIIPMMMEIPNVSEIGLFTSALLFFSVIFFSLIAWFLIGYAASLTGGVVGILLATITQILTWCYARYKRA